MCQYLHRIPTELDEARSMMAHSYDIFGKPLVRETEHGREYRGPTAQQRATKTLYINLSGGRAAALLAAWLAAGPAGSWRRRWLGPQAAPAAGRAPSTRQLPPRPARPHPCSPAHLPPLPRAGACHYETPALRRMVEDSFSPWGPIQSIFIARTKGLAFVKCAPASPPARAPMHWPRRRRAAGARAAARALPPPPAGLSPDASPGAPDRGPLRLPFPLAPSPRYRWRTSAEFAKEAMDGQGLVGSDMGEVLGVRWARAGSRVCVWQGRAGGGRAGRRRCKAARGRGRRRLAAAAWAGRGAGAQPAGAADRAAGPLRRWAHDDRAEQAQVMRKRDAQQLLGNAAMAQLEGLPPEVRRARPLLALRLRARRPSPASGLPPAPRLLQRTLRRHAAAAAALASAQIKRARMMQLQMGLLQQDTGSASRATADYPDTDDQYADAAQGGQHDASFDPAALGVGGAGQGAGAAGPAAAAAAAAGGDWAAYYDPAYYQQWVEYYAQQAAAGGGDGAAAAGAGQPAAPAGGAAAAAEAEAGGQAGQGGGAEALGLLAAYSSSSDEEG